MKRIMIAAPTTLFSATALFAATGVADIDMNNDDFASFEELTAVYQGLTREQFEQIDANNDNRVSSDELYAPESQEIVSLYEGEQLPYVLIDINGDGFSDYEEISSVFTGLSEEDFDQMDTNNDNRLSQFEVYDIEAQDILNRFRSMEEVATVGKADANGDNLLSESELMTAYPGLSENEFETIDTNGDNRVDFTELYEVEAQDIVSKYES